MDVQELHDRGLKRRVDMFGREAVDKRMGALGEFGKPLQHIINAYAYGDVWDRSALPPATKSLVMIAMMAAAGFVRQSGQTRSSIVRTDLSTLPPYGNRTIPSGIDRKPSSFAVCAISICE